MIRYYCNGKHDFCDDDKACVRCEYTNGMGGEWRTIGSTNYDHIKCMTFQQMSEELLPLMEEIMYDGVPSSEWMRMWLNKPYGADDAV